MFKLNITPENSGLNSIIASFNTTLNRLDTFIAQSTDRSRKLGETIQDMENERESIVSDIHRAKDIQKNIKSLIGDL